MTYSESYKEKLYELNEDYITSSPYGIITKEKEKSVISWKNDEFKIFSFVTKGINDPDYLGGIADYDTNYNKITSLGETDKKDFNHRGIVEQVESGTSTVQFDYNGTPLFEEDGIGGYQPFLIPEIVDKVGKFVVRSISTTENTYILNLDTSYQQKAIATILWNLVDTMNTSFMEKFFGTGTKHKNYGYHLFRRENGYAFVKAFLDLTNEIGTLRSITTLELEKNGKETIFLDWYVRENETTGIPEFHLNVNYQEENMINAIYDSFFWSFVHRQMFLLLKDSISGLIAGNVSLIANFHSLDVGVAENKKFANLLYLQVFDIVDVVVEEHLIVDNLREVNIPYFTNYEALAYLYRFFKDKPLIELINFDSYKNLIFKRI